MNFGQQSVRIRRMLRDPDGDIWNRSIIIDTFNDIQREIQIKTKFLENVSVVEIPPQYHYSYTHDWEWRFLPEDETKHYHCLRYSDQNGTAFCYQFEAEFLAGHTGTMSDEGYHVTHPWEVFMADAGEVVKFKFPADYHTTTYIAWDRKPLDYVEKKVLQRSDESYETTEGQPFCYYREDTLENDFILYPRPSTVEFNDDVIPQIEHVYTHDWESGLLDGTGEQFTKTDSTNNRTYIFKWEADPALEDFAGGRAMFHWELDSELGNLAIYTGTADEFGVSTNGFLSQEEGFDLDILEDADNVVLVYKSIPIDVSSDEDESLFPKFLRKYIEHGTLEQCYGANTDGKIASLAEYWRYRYMTGIGMIKRFMSMRKQDRVYQLRTMDRPPPRNMRHPRLPSSYPPI